MIQPVNRSRAVTLSLSGVCLIACLPAWGYPGSYAGSRILGGSDICAVFSESPTRTDTDFGVIHYYVQSYTRDYIRAAYPEFLLAGSRENARGTGDKIRAAEDLHISAGRYDVFTRFTSLAEPEIEIGYRVYAMPTGEMAWDIEIHNTGAAPKEIGVEPVVRFREAPTEWSTTRLEGNLFSRIVFEKTSLVVGFNDDRNISEVERIRGPFPGLKKQLTVSPRSIVNVRMRLFAAPPSGEMPAPGNLGDYETARLRWREWQDAGVSPPLCDSRISEAYDATLSALAATSLAGAVPADMTGQFVTEGRPQLYPRDALMTARALMEAGQVGLARQIITFWSHDIPEKSPGEWYARYDAEARATAGGSGAAYDVPEWDANGYYASLLLRFFVLTGERVGDRELMKRLLDFVISRQDTRVWNTGGLVREGGIIEWEGLLPATNMNLAAGMEAGALLMAMDGDDSSAERYRRAAALLSHGMDRLFSRSRGAYMDLRDGREQFNTSANFGFIWGYPDHLELALTNAWYRRNTHKLGGGVQYFEADGYGSDLFGFTTAASAQYHLVADDPDVGLHHLNWMMERSNVYGMMPERVLSPDGADVSPASPLSWCNGEFAVAILEAARVGDTRVIADADYPWRLLGRDLAGIRRLLEALAARGEENARTSGSAPESGEAAEVAEARRLAATITRALRACVEPVTWSERVATTSAALDELERVTTPAASISAPAPRSQRAGWRGDVSPLVARVAMIFRRLVWNQAGARMAVNVPSVARLGEDVDVSVNMSGPSGIRWTRVLVEYRDGNEVRMRRVTRLTDQGNEVAVRIPVRFTRGTAPFSSGVRVTVEGEWKGQWLSSSHAVALEVKGNDIP